MAVAPASMGDEIIVLDEDNEDSPQPSFSATTPSSEHGSRNALPPKGQHLVAVHAAMSPSRQVSGKKEAQGLLAENQKLFSEVSCFRFLLSPSSLLCSSSTSKIKNILTPSRFLSVLILLISTVFSLIFCDKICFYVLRNRLLETFKMLNC